MASHSITTAGLCTVLCFVFFLRSPGSASCHSTYTSAIRRMWADRDKAWWRWDVAFCFHAQSWPGLSCLTRADWCTRAVRLSRGHSLLPRDVTVGLSLSAAGTGRPVWRRAGCGHRAGPPWWLLGWLAGWLAGSFPQLGVRQWTPSECTGTRTESNGASLSAARPGSSCTQTRTTGRRLRSPISTTPFFYTRAHAHGRRHTLRKPLGACIGRGRRQVHVKRCVHTPDRVTLTAARAKFVCYCA